MRASAVDMGDWPCAPAALTAAKDFLRRAVDKGGKIVLAPDRDADGLCAGKFSVILMNAIPTQSRASAMCAISFSAMPACVLSQVFHACVKQSCRDYAQITSRACVSRNNHHREMSCMHAGATLHRTLSALGASAIEAYFLPKGDNIHSSDATAALSQYDAAALIVLDQGSRAGPPILPGVPTLILDHHQSTVFPEEAEVCMAVFVKRITCLMLHVITEQML